MPDSSRSDPAPGVRQTLVGGAPVSRAQIEAALVHAPRLVAVDGGADAVLAAGLVPDLVVGDLDSISPAARAAFADRTLHIAEQDSTDFAKALRSSPAALSLGVGFIGARADHFLSVLTAMAQAAAPVILLSREECICLAPASLSLDLAPGTRVSLWPLGPARGTSRGLRWPIDGIAFSPVTRTGTSNEATGPVTLSIEGDMVLLLPADVLPDLLAAFARSRGADATAL